MKKKNFLNRKNKKNRLFNKSLSNLHKKVNDLTILCDNLYSLVLDDDLQSVPSSLGSTLFVSTDTTSDTYTDSLKSNTDIIFNKMDQVFNYSYDKFYNIVKITGKLFHDYSIFVDKHSYKCNCLILQFIDVKNEDFTYLLHSFLDDLIIKCIEKNIVLLLYNNDNNLVVYKSMFVFEMDNADTDTDLDLESVIGKRILNSKFRAVDIDYDHLHINNETFYNIFPLLDDSETY